MSKEMTIQDVFEALDAKFDRVIGVMATKDDIKHLDKRIDGIEERLDKLTKAVEHLASSVDTLLTEYAAIKTQMDRHDRWLKQLAAHAGIELVP